MPRWAPGGPPLERGAQACGRAPAQVPEIPERSAAPEPPAVKKKKRREKKAPEPEPELPLPELPPEEPEEDPQVRAVSGCCERGALPGRPRFMERGQARRQAG